LLLGHSQLIPRFAGHFEDVKGGPVDRSEEARRRAMTIAVLSALGGAAATGLLMGGLALADQDGATTDQTTTDPTVTDDDLWSGQTSPWSDDDGADSGSGSSVPQGPGSGSSGRTGGS